MHIVVTTNDYAMHAFVNGELLFSKSKPLSTYDYRPERVSRLSHVLGATKSVDGGEAKLCSEDRSDDLDDSIMQLIASLLVVSATFVVTLF
ncbi:hypothetical protein TL16_g11566 [Triparma laevis f. inornata]|uniref:Uncharacterized protein n=1 Tax=Triparma laevis f. inornata TaxID=1714386 RepID=A0A9W7ETY9_9STRA|nr:hypothetical protein TL16_g11566 [Triparma laevis f. inornata]